MISGISFCDILSAKKRDYLINFLFRSHSKLLTLPSSLFYHHELLACAEYSLVKHFEGSSLLTNPRVPFIFHGIRVSLYSYSFCYIIYIEQLPYFYLSLSVKQSWSPCPWDGKDTLLVRITFPSGKPGRNDENFYPTKNFFNFLQVSNLYIFLT